jgi:formate--tetrahydrofolate ligase
MTDIEIAKKSQIQYISKIAEKLGIDSDKIETFGKYKAK